MIHLNIYNPCSIHIDIQMGFQLDYMIHNHPPNQNTFDYYTIGNEN